jgi:hypothetical protein
MTSTYIPMALADDVEHVVIHAAVSRPIVLLMSTSLTTSLLSSSLSLTNSSFVARSRRRLIGLELGEKPSYVGETRQLITQQQPFVEAAVDNAAVDEDKDEESVEEEKVNA